MKPFTFIFFGATGDLAKRKIFPALYNLELEDKLPQDFTIIGLGRKEIKEEDFQTHVYNSLVEFSRIKPNNHDSARKFLNKVKYASLDVNNQSDYKRLLDVVKDIEKTSNSVDRMFYLSVGPELFVPIATNIKESGLGDAAGWKRLIIEKPFGRDLTSARQLNQQLSESFKEDEIYRIDHYLGKSMVQNIESIRFSNPIVEHLWNHHHIANVQITASEIVGVEDRAGYYDQSGAIRDMVQNHMLQMLMLAAMEPASEGSSIRDEKVKVLKAIKRFNNSTITSQVVRGQYTEGEINGRQITSYISAPGVKEHSTTDTFISTKIEIDNERWANVPFYIRTGKSMKEKVTKIVVEFKKQNGTTEEPSLFIISINPTEGVQVTLNSKNPVTNRVNPITVEYKESSNSLPEAYERLIFDALIGDSNFFARWDEVEESWKLIQPVLDVFEGDYPVHYYQAGQQGPTEAHIMLEKDGFKWWE